MKKRIKIGIFAAVLLLAAAGCGRKQETHPTADSNGGYGAVIRENKTSVTLTKEITELENGLFAVQQEGEYGFEQFLAQGGAASDNEVAVFLTENLLKNVGLGFSGNFFGCSTLSVRSPEGEVLFGRNFDWNHCNTLIVRSNPENGYASIATVNMDFINAGSLSTSRIPPDVLTIAAMYAPLDGMNEKGLTVSVNMIQDSDTIHQNTGKPDITTTTAVRLLLNRAANAEEAVQLLEQYDMHTSMGYMIHFAIADNDGHHVVVEYVNNRMTVTDTPVVTNFYLTAGEKYGIGTAQSHERYEILTSQLKESHFMSMADVRDALDSVSKDNFGEFESTEWSIVYNQSTGEVHYYHRENYQNSFIFTVERNESK